MALTYRGAGILLPLPEHALRLPAPLPGASPGNGLLDIPLLHQGAGQLLLLPNHAPKTPAPALHFVQYLTMPSSYKVEQGDTINAGYEGPRIYPPPYALRPE